LIIATSWTSNGKYGGAVSIHSWNDNVENDEGFKSNRKFNSELEDISDDDNNDDDDDDDEEEEDEDEDWRDDNDDDEIDNEDDNDDEDDYIDYEGLDI